ncbi:MAG TPA: hypothetical protein VEO00_09820 [Actinomycetota bacterium]|nr:hypothetical protein [Actinomycetota bacterium]
MNDLRSHLAQLERTPPPDLWPDIETRRPRRRVPDPDLPRRILAAFVALALAAGGLIVAVRAFTGTKEVAPAQEVTGRAEDLPLECTVRLLTPEVEPGGPVETEFVYRNVGESDLQVATGPARLLVDDRAGTAVYDTDFSGYLTGGNDFARPFPLPAGQAVRWPSVFHSLWGGTIALHPRCEYSVLDADKRREAEGVIEPGPLHVTVASSGGSPNREDALALALEPTGHLFDRCAVTADGRPVRGWVDPPDGDLGVPSQEATCRATVRQEPGFAVVDLMFASPPDVPLPEPSESRTRGLALPGQAVGTITRWTFLVRDGAAREIVPGPLEDLDPELVRVSSLSTAPDRCAFEDRDLACSEILYVPTADGWASGEIRERDPEPASRDGIVFFAPSPDVPLEPPTTLASGSFDGKAWSFEIFRAVGGLRGRAILEDQPPERVITLAAPSPAEICGARLIAGILGDTRQGLLISVTASPRVVRMDLIAGDQVTAMSLVSIPPGYDAPFSFWLFVGENPPPGNQPPELAAYDRNGIRIDHGEC